MIGSRGMAVSGTGSPVGPDGATLDLRLTEIGEEALVGLPRGRAAADRYDRESARIGYGRALDESRHGFFEAREALARVARLRAGESLGNR